MAHKKYMEAEKGNFDCTLWRPSPALCGTMLWTFRQAKKGNYGYIAPHCVENMLHTLQRPCLALYRDRGGGSPHFTETRLRTLWKLYTPHFMLTHCRVHTMQTQIEHKNTFR